jgi:F420-dependent oxidoreductase-like protein
MAKARKVIITCAVTGSIHTPSMSPHLPVTPDQIVEQAQRAEADGFASLWFASIVQGDPLVAMALAGRATTTIELGTAVLQTYPCHPLLQANRAASVVDAMGRPGFTLGIGPSHHWIISDQLGLPYARPARLVCDYIDVLSAAFAGPGAVAIDNESYCVHSPIDVADAVDMPVLLAALGPTMLRIAGERTDGTILWMADERAIGDYVVPRITQAADTVSRSGIRVVAGVPVALCAASEVDEARAYAGEVLGHADFSPNYVRLLEHGDATDVGDTMAAGDEATVLARLRRYRDAGVTDLAARVVPLGENAAARGASRRRFQEFVASLVPEFASGA